MAVADFWKDRPDLSTPATAANLNAREAAVKADARAQTATDVATPGTDTRDALDAAFAQALAPGYPLASQVTDGAYVRASAGFRPLAVDPAVSGRVWGISGTDIGYKDSNGTGTFVVGAANPAAPQAVVQLTFSPTHTFILTTASTDRSGQLWRGSLPIADGTGMSFVAPNGKMFDLTGGTTTISGGVDGGVGSYFRNSCFAINGNNGYLIEYGDTITGGPSFYQNSNIYTTSAGGGLWSKRKTWANARHGHSVKVFGGVPWVLLGDAGATNVDVGLWRATLATAAVWNQASLYGEALGGTTLYGVSMLGVTLAGHPIILMESDTRRGLGPLAFNSQALTSYLAIVPTCEIPFPYKGTMRQMTLTAEGNLMWVTTGENGAVGPFDSIWMAPPPFTNPILLEAIPSANTLGTLGDPVESGPYVYFGAYRITKPTLL